MIHMLQVNVAHKHRSRIVLGVVPIWPLLLLLLPLLLLLCPGLIRRSGVISQENWMGICWEYRMAQMQVASFLNAI